MAAVPSCGKKQAAPETALPEIDLAAINRNKGKEKTLNPVADGFEYLYEEKEHGRRTLLTAARAEPGPQGTQILTQPRATLALAPHRVLVLSAPKATFTIPKKQPRDGLFSGTPDAPVVFTLYECEPGKTPDLSGTGDIRMKVFFEGNARFDLERDGVTSDAPVQVTGPALEFRGAGVQLTWNRLAQRMEQFDISKGDMLMARQEKDAQDKPKQAWKTLSAKRLMTPDDAAEKRRAARSLFRPGEQDLTLHWSGPLSLRPIPLPADASAADLAQAKATPLYAATLLGDIRGHLDAVKAEDDATFGGAQLDMTFVMATQSGRQDDAAKAESVAPASGHDTLTLAGNSTAQAFIRTNGGHTVQGETLFFARDSGMVKAQGLPQRPIALRTPEGWLTGLSLALDLRAGKGSILGPGRLETSTQAMPGQNAKEDAKANTEPKLLRLAYADRIEMDFTPQTGKNLRLGNPTQTRLLGSIQGEHPDFGFVADRMTLDFEQTASAKDKVHPEQVLLEGPTSKITLRDPKQGSVAVTSPLMRLKLETVGGRAAPAAFVAAGPVEAVQADGSTLTCDRLDVAFVAPSATKEKTATKADKRGEGAVASLHATGHARYAGKADGKQANLAADRLTADVREETLELTGTPQAHAKLETQGMALSGEHVSLKKEGGVARVAGPGHLDILTKDKQHLAVSWQGKMGWDDAKGLGRFEKQVDCAADTPDSAHTLHADDLLLLEVDPTAKGKDAKDRTLRLADARGKVVFTGTKTNDDGRLAGRVRVDGPVLVVKNAATEADPKGEQSITVTGKGLMLIENFNDQTKKAGGAEAFGGQGATYFAWKKDMVANLSKNNLRLRQDARIRHLPLKANGQYAPVAEAIELSCQEVHANLGENGGLGGLHGKRPAGSPAPELRQMTGDHGVQLRRGEMTVEADHLRYDGDKKQAQLWSDPPRKVEISAQGQDNPAAADRLTWNVATDTLKAENPSGGALPQWKKK